MARMVSRMDLGLARSMVERGGAMTSPSSGSSFKSSLPTCPVAPVRRMVGLLMVLCFMVDAKTHVSFGCAQPRFLISCPCGRGDCAWPDDVLRSLQMSPCRCPRPCGASLSDLPIRVHCTLGSDSRSRAYRV